MLIILPYLAFCVVLAYDNSQRIKAGKRIYHGLNGALHLLATGATFWAYGWNDSLSLLLSVRVVFDVSLNLFRGLGIGYVSPKPKSWIDKAEKWVFRNDGITPKIVYLFAVLCLQLLK